MTSIPIAFRSNKAKYSFAGSAELVNAYPEQYGPDAKAPLAVVPTDGLIEFATITDTPCRGLIYLEDVDRLLTFHSSSVYEVQSDGTTLSLGAIPGIVPVQLCRNQKTTPQVGVLTSTYGFQLLEWNGAQFVITGLADADVPTTPESIDFIDGYTIYANSDRSWLISALNDMDNVDPLDTATFEQQAGTLVRVKAHNGKLYGMCSRWIEVWQDTGNSSFPFEPLPVHIPIGLKAKFSVTDTGNALAFVSDEDTVVLLEGTQYVKISTPEVDELIKNDSAPESIIGFSWERGGHSFICFKGTDWAQSYDVTKGVWHKRTSTNLGTKWQAQYAVKAWNKVIVGSADSGKLLYMDSDTFTEDGDTIVWSMKSPTIHVFPHGAIMDAVHFDVAVGKGDVSSASQGFDPSLMLSWSTDGGNTFKGNRIIKIGKSGKYTTRVYGRRLGRFDDKGVIFKLDISDPVIRSIIEADLQLRPLKR